MTRRPFRQRLLPAVPFGVALLLSLLAIIAVSRFASYWMCFYAFTLDDDGLDHSPEEIASYCWETRMLHPFGSYSPPR